MKKIFNYMALGVLGMGLTASCGDFLDEYSQDLITARTVTDLNELLVGDVYLRSHTVNKGMTQGVYGFVNMLDDDINTTGSSGTKNAHTTWREVVAQMWGYFAWQQDVRLNFSGTSRPDDNATWNTLYRHINHANNIIDIIDDMPRSTDDDKILYHRVKGEAHFVRAQFYLALANLYGPAYNPETTADSLCVPLKLTSHVEHDKEKDTQFERATNRAVYATIVNDLKIAREQLTVSPQDSRRRLHRATAEAASLLLSRVCLYMQDWKGAEVAAKEVMSSKNFSLAAISTIKQGTPFLTAANPEMIFSQGANFVAPRDELTSLTASPADFCVTRDLYDSFDPSDARRQAFFVINTVTDSVRLTEKYERGLELNHISDGFALRMAEAYLNYAEACAMQPGKEAEANATLKALRQERIFNYEHTDVTGAKLVEEIRQERRRELCFEGHRWFDLRRYAVNKEYPFSKNIVHVFNAFDEAASFAGSHTYILPAGDPAYQFSIPAKVQEFDKVPMPNNIRPKRPEVKPETERPSFPVFDDEDEENGEGGGETEHP